MIVIASYREQNGKKVMTGIAIKGKEPNDSPKQNWDRASPTPTTRRPPGGASSSQYSHDWPQPVRSARVLAGWHL